MSISSKMSSFCSPAPIFSSSAGKMSSFSSGKKPVAKKAANSASGAQGADTVIQQQIDYYALKTMHIIRQRVSTANGLEVCVNLKTDSVVPDSTLSNLVHTNSLVEKIKTLCRHENRYAVAWLDTHGMKPHEIATIAVSVPSNQPAASPSIQPPQHGNPVVHLQQQPPGNPVVQLQPPGNPVVQLQQQPPGNPVVQLQQQPVPLLHAHQLVGNDDLTVVQLH